MKSFLQKPPHTTPVLELHPIPVRPWKNTSSARVIPRPPSLIIHICRFHGRAHALLLAGRPPTGSEITALYNLLPKTATSLPRLAKMWDLTAVLATHQWSLIHGVSRLRPSHILTLTL